MKFFYTIVFCIFLKTAHSQIINLNFENDTITVSNIFKDIENLKLSKLVNAHSISEFYWQIKSISKVDAKTDKIFSDKSIRLGDISFGLLISSYVDTICKSCEDTKKKLFFWYLMNYYFTPTGILYNDSEGPICPCLIKKIEYPDGGTYLVDSISKMFCVPIFSNSLNNYNKIYTYNYLKNWKKLVTNWEKLIPTFKSNEDSTIKHGFKFKYKGVLYSDTINFSYKRTNFFKNIPPLGKDLSVINQPMDSSVKKSLLSFLDLKLKIFNSNVEKVNFLLAFVQQCVVNKTDMELFGIDDKTLLPEETLFRAAGDCEDKSFLFAYLLKNLLKKSDSIVIVYENHVSVGVNLISEQNLNLVKFNGKSYALCETTGLQKAGEVINSPKYNDIRAVIPIK